MIKLVSFLRINFFLIIISFFLPFFPDFSCEKHSETTSVDTTAIVIETPYTEINNSSDSFLKEGVNKDSVKLGNDSISNRRFETSGLFSTIIYSGYSNDKLFKRSITGIGCVIFTFIKWIDGSGFNEPLNYLLPISFIAALLGIIFSIKSKRKKQPFIFLFSMVGLLSLSTIGFLCGMELLLFGFWITAILYLINSLLGFILWKNFK